MHAWGMPSTEQRPCWQPPAPSPSMRVPLRPQAVVRAERAPALKPRRCHEYLTASRRCRQPGASLAGRAPFSLVSVPGAAGGTQFHLRAEVCRACCSSGRCVGGQLLQLLCWQAATESRARVVGSPCLGLPHASPPLTRLRRRTALAAVPGTWVAPTPAAAARREWACMRCPQRPHLAAPAAPSRCSPGSCCREREGECLGSQLAARSQVPAVLRGSSSCGHQGGPAGCGLGPAGKALAPHRRLPPGRAERPPPRAAPQGVPPRRCGVRASGGAAHAARHRRSRRRQRGRLACAGHRAAAREQRRQR